MNALVNGRLTVVKILGPNVVRSWNLYVSTDTDLLVHASLSEGQLRMVRDAINQHFEDIGLT